MRERTVTSQVVGQFRKQSIILIHLVLQAYSRSDLLPEAATHMMWALQHDLRVVMRTINRYFLPSKITRLLQQAIEGFLARSPSSNRKLGWPR